MAKRHNKLKQEHIGCRLPPTALAAGFERHVSITCGDRVVGVCRYNIGTSGTNERGIDEYVLNKHMR